MADTETSQPATGPVTASAEEWRALALEAMAACGVPATHAGPVADLLIEADMRGVASHGLTRVANYMQRVIDGGLDPHATPEIEQDAGAWLLMDGRNGFGVVAGLEATRLAAERARQHGFGWVNVRRSNHIGMLAFYTRRLALEGLMGLAVTNASPAMAPWGGNKRLLGTNPISIAMPAAGDPVVLDMATSLVARGKIRRAELEGRDIPPDWALDVEGNPTTDAGAAIDGTVAPAGAHKGSGLAVMIDMLCGLGGGGALGSEIALPNETDRPAGTGFVIAAASFAAFQDRAAYDARTAEFAADLKACGEGEIFLPGEIEERKMAEAQRDGITLPPDVVDALNALAKEEG